MAESTGSTQWFALKVCYIAARKLASMLPPELGTTFVPPVINNILFINSTRLKLQEWQKFSVDGKRTMFMYDCMTHEPITIRQQEMERFMHLCQVSALPIVMTEKPEVRLGSKVRVTDGPLKGLEGHVVRMQKSKRILVEIPGVLWAATEFVGPDFLEVIEP